VKYRAAMRKKILPWIASAWRISAKWVLYMSGGFSILRELIGLMANIAGRPIPPTSALAIFGHMAVIAFVIAGFSEWLFLRSRIKDLEAKTDRPGKQHVASVAARIEQGYQLKAIVPGKDATPETVKNWRDALNNWVNETHQLLTSISVQSDMKFRDLSGLIDMFYDKIHDDLHHEYDVLTHMVGNLTQIIERPSDFLC
jgi:hypothetical protein